MNLNLIEILFLNFTTVTIILGALVNFIEPHLPVMVVHAIRFGKLSYCDRKNVLLQNVEVPKAWFKHFYVFALLWSLLALCVNLYTILLTEAAPSIVINFLNLLAGGKDRRMAVDSISGLIALSLLTLQCCRRFYETHFIQIFSSSGTINISQYIVGFLHYFGSVIVILANTEGFVSDAVSNGLNFSMSFHHLLGVVLFMYSWTQQYKCNVILSNLRRDSFGKVVTEKHFLPEGGYFDFISSPHMFFEILMYVAILIIIPGSKMWWLVTLWVISNQTETAWLTHKWYHINIKDYPKHRYAIYPFIL